MSLLLCRRERVKHPFYIEVLGIHIYSSQELCYVIYHHPLPERVSRSMVATLVRASVIAGRMT